MASRDDWHDGSIYDAKAFNPFNTQLWVYHSVRIGVGSHLARTHLVLQGCGYCPCGAFPVFVRTEMHVFTPREWNLMKFTVKLLKCFGLAQGNCLVEEKEMFKYRNVSKCYVKKMGGGKGMTNGRFTVKLVTLQLLGLSAAPATSKAVHATLALGSHCDTIL